MYLKSLQYNYQTEQRIERDRLLAQLMNLDENMTLAEKQQAIHDTIISDWQDFNLTCEGEYKYYNGTFSNFLDEYTNNMVRLAELQRQQLEILSSFDLLQTNDQMSNIFQGITNSGDIANAIGMTDADKAMLDYAGKLWNQGNTEGNQDLMEYAHELAESIRDKYGFSGGDDGSGFFITDIDKLEEAYNNQESILVDVINSLIKYNSGLSGQFNTEKYLNDIRNGNQADNLTEQQKNYLNQAGINTDIVNNWISYNADSSAQYDLQTMEFDNFLTKYASQIAEYASLQNQLNSLQNSLNLSGGLNGLEGLNGLDLGNIISGGGGGGSAPTMSAADQAALDEAGRLWNEANAKGDQAGMEAAHAMAEAIRDKYGYSGGDDGSQVIYKGSSSSGGSGSSGSSSSSSSGSSGSSYDSSKGSFSDWLADNGAPSWVVNSEKQKEEKGGYAEGLENGPITYTGLAMLHGTKAKPEYVLNNDQAYNLLYNLSASKMAPFETVNKSEQGDTWNLYGDINVDGAEDPAEFWNTVMNSAGNRWNTTKNKRK